MRDENINSLKEHKQTVDDADVLKAQQEVETKVEETTGKVEDMIFTAQAPIRLAKQYPYANAALSLMGGFFIGAWLSGKWGAGESAGTAQIQVRRSSEESRGGRLNLVSGQDLP